MKINVDVNGKKTVDNEICGKQFICDPINCECECDKSCDV